LLASDSDGQVGSGTISRRELQQLMRLLADGDEVSSDEVEFVLLLADHPATESHVIQSDLIRPLAMWRGLQEEMDFIEARFHSYDTNNTGRLDREQLASMIKDVNGGHAASPEEINWMLSLSTDGKSLTHMQSRLAITIWFHHVAPPNIKARVGRPMLVPFIYTLLACTASAVVVAATTVLFSEQKTKEWLAAVGMSLLWRNCLIDPLKAVMCGRSFEFVFALVLGGGALEEAGVGLLQDEIEGQGEAVAEGAQDVVTDLADDGGEELVGAVGGDGAVGGIEGELTAGAGRPDRELSDDDDDIFDLKP
jgi:Ca2+-binding EF-hand superfamily protein